MHFLTPFNLKPEIADQLDAKIKYHEFSEKLMDDLLARIDRIESTLAIQQLPIRYAMAVDGRDLDGWVSLFVDDVDCGRRGKGRDALKTFIEPTLTSFYRSQHFICGHRIDFVDADHATGAVYCRAEHEDGDKWVIMAICYFDTYERRDGTWYFVRRREAHWYASDLLAHPSGPNFSNWPNQKIPDPSLPHAFPSWAPYWEKMGDDAVALRTRYPVK